jgi:hypothetical protein
VFRSRRTEEVVWKEPEELKKLYGKYQKYCRRCMERKRSTLKDVWKGPEDGKLWKVTTEAVW